MGETFVLTGGVQVVIKGFHERFATNIKPLQMRQSFVEELCQSPLSHGMVWGTHSGIIAYLQEHVDLQE